MHRTSNESALERPLQICEQSSGVLGRNAGPLSYLRLRINFMTPIVAIDFLTFGM